MVSTTPTVRWSDLGPVTSFNVDVQMAGLKELLAGQRYTLIAGQWDRSLPGVVATGVRLAEDRDQPIEIIRRQLSESRPGRRLQEAVTLRIHQSVGTPIAFAIPANRQAGECKFRIYPQERKAILVILVPNQPTHYWIFALETTID